jgi:acyl carrier protein
VSHSGSDSIEAWAVSACESLGLSGHTVDAASRLAELGIDSPDLVEIIHQARTEFGVQVSMLELAVAETVADIADSLRKAIADGQQAAT